MLTNLSHISMLATLVDFVGTLLIGISASRTVVRSGGTSGVITSLQYRIAADLLTALSFKSGADIIRTLTVTDWSRFLLLLAIISLRLFLGQTFGHLYKS